jgi:hypothetical protein
MGYVNWRTLDGDCGAVASTAIAMFPAVFHDVAQPSALSRSNGWSEIAGYDDGALVHPPLDGTMGALVTEIDDELLTPPLVAVMLTEPADTAVTRPLEDTVATAVLLLDHVTVRPVRIVPMLLTRLGVSC